MPTLANLPRRLRRLLPRSRRARSWLVLVVLLLAAVIAMVRFLSAPSQGHITSVHDQLTKAQTTPKQKLAPATTISNDYFSLPLPPGYVQQGASVPPGLLFAQTVTKSGALGSLIIGIAVKPMPDGGLSGDSSFQLRQQQTARYALSTQQIDGDTLHIANDKTSAAVVAFWPHSKYLATLSISSGLDNPSSDDNADELAALQPLLAAWQWR